MMTSILLADSGSTKTDWVWLYEGKKKKKFQTTGINPMIQTEKDIAGMMLAELPWNNQKNQLDDIHFYGAGVSTAIQKRMMRKLLNTHFEQRKSNIYSDMLGAARSLCGDEPGVVCILGTGSNSCYFDGKRIKDKMPSLGYIAGDEGSGNHLGKAILRYYLYNTFDTELKLAFEYRFGTDKDALIRQLYQSPFPNRYLASFVPLLLDFRGHYMVENIIEDSLSEFFRLQILKYRQSWQMPVHFIGSVAYELRDVIKSMCAQSELELGKIERSPLPGLIQYHSQLS